MNPLDTLLSITHHVTEYVVHPAWDQAEPMLHDLGQQVLQSFDPQQLTALVPDQTWQNLQNNLQSYASSHDYSQPQTYETAPSFEPAHAEFQTQPLVIEPSYLSLEMHATVGLRAGFEPEYHLNEANKALSDASYHMGEATTHSESANWYAENYDKVVFGESKADFQANWAADELDKANAKLKEAADEISKAKTST